MWQATVVKRLRLVIYIAWLGIKSSYEYRAAFWLQVFGMVFNNAAFVVLLAVFYMQFDNIHGWRLQDTMLVYGMATVGVGLLQLFFANAMGNKLGERIVQGDLDSYMLFPQSTLFHLSIRKIDISGFGDMLSGVSFVALSGHINSLSAFFLAIVAILFAAVCMYGTAILIQSSTFWFAGMRGIGNIVESVTLMPANWPPQAFTGVAKLIFLGMFPALFVCFLPGRLVSQFAWMDLSILALFAVGINLAARIVFAIGLRRYESGNLMTTNL